jgi:mRNA interferase RelE/StbE
MHSIILHKNAARFYEKARAPLKDRIAAAIDLIAENPRSHPHIKKLKGELKNNYRFRLGGLRII